MKYWTNLEVLRHCNELVVSQDLNKNPVSQRISYNASNHLPTTREEFVAVGAGKQLVFVEISEVRIQLAPGFKHRPARTARKHLQEH